MKFDPSLWFTDRIVYFIPKHFIKTSTPRSAESTRWVETKLCGRYAIGKTTVQLVVPPMFGLPTGGNLPANGYFYYFEDSKEAMLYELMWAGNN